MILTTDSAILMMLAEQYQALVEMREQCRILSSENESLRVQLQDKNPSD